MRNFILFIVIFLFAGCKSIKNIKGVSIDNIIVYILPPEVESILYNHLSKIKNTSDITLDIRRFEDYFVVFVSNTNVFWKKVSNRKVLIGKQFFPVLLDLDYFFCTTEKSKDVINRLELKDKNDDILRKRIIPFYDHTFKVKFTKKGKVVFKGFKDNW